MNFNFNNLIPIIFKNYYTTKNINLMKNLNFAVAGN